MTASTPLRGSCFHQVPGGCRYCRAIEIADEGPCHTGPGRQCGACADWYADETGPLAVVAGED